jgi:hypothetical protein
MRFALAKVITLGAATLAYLAPASSAVASAPATLPGYTTTTQLSANGQQAVGTIEVSTSIRLSPDKARQVLEASSAYPTRSSTVFTGQYWPYVLDGYHESVPVYTYTYKACVNLNLVEWTECMSGRIYYAYSTIDGQGVVVWGKNYTFHGLRGSQYCHTTGSRTIMWSYHNMSCGEHRYDPNKYVMKQWDQFEMSIVGTASEVYAFNVRMYGSGHVGVISWGLGS